MTIRPATEQDVPDVVTLGQQFLATSHYADVIPENLGQMAVLAECLIKDGGLFVAEGRGGDLVGMIGLMTFTHHLSGLLTAGEVFWYVQPSARGTAGVRLLKRAEEWARSRGAVALQMIAPDERVASFYDRCGYTEVEIGFMRTL
jgi:GNAT superfamily N-acetyltransferase